MEKIKIEDSVQETLLMAVVGRAEATKRFPQSFKDYDAVRIAEKIEEADEYRAAAANLAYFGLRQAVLAEKVKEYLERYPEARVVNIGGGLDTTFSLVDNGQIHYITGDLADVIALRNRILPAGEREMNLAMDLNKKDWYGKLGYEPEKGIVFLSGGVSYYIPEASMRALVQNLAKAFPGSRFVFDAVNPMTMKKTNKLLEKAGNHEARCVFGLDKPEKIGKWSPLIENHEIITDYLSYVPHSEMSKHIRLMLWLIGKMKMLTIHVLDFKK